jgi:peroxiredoxin
MTSKDRAPDFAIGRADGQIISLSDFSGYPLVLWFGGTHTDAFRSDQLAWCTQLMAGVSDGQGELLAVEVDGAWCELKFRHQTVRVGLAAGLPADGPVARAYGVEGREAIFVVDGDGTIQWRHISPPDARPPIAAMLAALTRTAAEPGPRPSDRRDFIVAALAATFLLAAHRTVATSGAVSGLTSRPGIEQATSSPSQTAIPGQVSATLSRNSPAST